MKLFSLLAFFAKVKVKSQRIAWNASWKQLKIIKLNTYKNSMIFKTEKGFKKIFVYLMTCQVIPAIQPHKGDIALIWELYVNFIAIMQ